MEGLGRPSSLARREGDSQPENLGVLQGEEAAVSCSCVTRLDLADLRLRRETLLFPSLGGRLEVRALLAEVFVAASALWGMKGTGGRVWQSLLRPGVLAEVVRLGWVLLRLMETLARRRGKEEWEGEAELVEEMEWE